MEDLNLDPTASDIEAGEMMQTSGIGDKDIPDLPMPDPKSKGFEPADQVADRGGNFAAVQTVPCGPPQKRSNHDINPDRQPYCSFQGSSYSHGDARRMKWIDDLAGDSLSDADDVSWIGSNTRWQSGPSHNEPTMDHTVENAGYWSTNNGLNSNWRNWSENSGKAYHPAILEMVASDKAAGKCLLYNLGHGTPHSTPASLEHNVIGASGFVTPFPDGSEKRDGDNDPTYCNARVAHMYLMYMLDVTSEEWSEYQEDFSEWGDWLEGLGQSIRNQDPGWLLEERQQKVFATKVPYKPHYATMLRGLRKLISDHWKRDVPSVEPMIEQMKEGTLTVDDIFMYAIRNDKKKPTTAADRPTLRQIEQCPYTFEELFHWDKNKRVNWWADPTKADWFHPSVIDPDGEVFGNFNPWETDEKEIWNGLWAERKRRAEEEIFGTRKQKSTRGKKPPRPGGGSHTGRPGGNKPGGNNGNNNRPNHPNWIGGNGGGNNNHPDAPPRPDVPDRPGDRDAKERWEAKKWRKDLHDKEFPHCQGPPCQHYGNGPHDGKGPDGQKATWSESLWQGYHDNFYPKCPGKWNGKGTGKWCKHQPAAFNPDNKDKVPGTSVDPDDKWGGLSEKTKKYHWNKWHQYHCPECPGQWDPKPGHKQLKATNGYCCHHPKYEENLPPAWKRPDDMPDKQQNIVGGGDKEDRDKNKPDINIGANNQGPDNIRDQLYPGQEGEDVLGKDWWNKIPDEGVTIHGDGPADNITINKDENNNPTVNIGVDKDKVEDHLNHEIDKDKHGDWTHGNANIHVDDDGVEISFDPHDRPDSPGNNLDFDKIPDGGVHLETNTGGKVNIDKNNDTGKIEVELEDLGPVQEGEDWFDWDDWTDRDPIIRDPDDKITSDEELERRLNALKDQGVDLAPGVNVNKDPDKDKITIEIDPDARPDSPPNLAERLPSGGVDLHGGTHIEVGDDHAVDISIPNIDLEHEWPDGGYDLGNGTRLELNDDGMITIHRPGINEPHNRPQGDNLPEGGLHLDWGDVTPGNDGGVDIHLPSGSLDQNSLDRIPDHGLDLPNGGEVVKNPDGSLEIRLRDPDEFTHVIGEIDTNSGNHYEVFRDPDNNGEITIKLNGNKIDLGDVPANDIDEIAEKLDKLHENKPPSNGLPPILSENEDKYKELFDRIDEAYRKKQELKYFIQWMLDWIEKIEIYLQAGEAGAIALAIEVCTKMLGFIFVNSFDNLKEADYIAELKVPQRCDDGGFPMKFVGDDHDRYTWKDPYPEFFNLLISPQAQIFVNLMKARFNGYLVDTRPSDRSGIRGAVVRMCFEYLTPTYSPGFCATDFEMKMFRRIPRQYPDPKRGTRGGVGWYEANPRFGRSIGLQRQEHQMQRQAEWSDLAEEHLGYFRPDFAQIIKGPKKQYPFKTQGGETWHTGTCEEKWGEVWRTTGPTNNDSGTGYYMHNIYSELGFGFQVDCNYQSSDTYHAVPMELHTMDPSPWPAHKLGADGKPRLTVDLQHMNLNTHDKSRKASRCWQMACISLNFFDAKGNRRHIKMVNVEDNWRGEGHEEHPEWGPGYMLRNDNKNSSSTERPRQLGQDNIEDHWKKQQTDPDNFNAGRVRAPLWLQPTDASWSSAQSWWDPETCKFIGLSLMFWPTKHEGGEGAAGSAGKAWHTCLFKKLRFVAQWPNNPGHPDYDLINTDQIDTRGYDPTFTSEYCRRP